jgi:hypothetical protein
LAEVAVKGTPFISEPGAAPDGDAHLRHRNQLDGTSVAITGMSPTGAKTGTGWRHGGDQRRDRERDQVHGRRASTDLGDNGRPGGEDLRHQADRGGGDDRRDSRWTLIKSQNPWNDRPENASQSKVTRATRRVTW